MEIDNAERANSTVPRRQLGRFLRQQRESAGKTVKAASDYLECSTQKLWRIEKGAVPVRGPEVKILCEFYGTEAHIVEALVALAKETKARGWWQSYGDVVPEWFELFVGLEGAADHIRKYEPQLVPGLLQARAYMEAVIRADCPQYNDDQVEQRIRIKQKRQGLMSRHFPPPPRIEVIISEGVLRGTTDFAGAMQQQLWHLLKANELDTASVRVLPLSVGPHRASVTGAFTILEFPSSEHAESGEPPTVYSESLTGALYLDKPRELEAYEQVWSNLDSLSLNEADSNTMLRKVLGEMSENERS